MSVKENIERLSDPTLSNWVKDTKEKIASKGFRRNARKIALEVLHYLEEHQLSQAQFADTMGIARQQVTKIVSGKENLTLETIDKLEHAMGIKLITVGEVKPSKPEGSYGFTMSTELLVASYEPIWDKFGNDGEFTMVFGNNVETVIGACGPNNPTKRFKVTRKAKRMEGLDYLQFFVKRDHAEIFQPLTAMKLPA